MFFPIRIVTEGHAPVCVAPITADSSPTRLTSGENPHPVSSPKHINARFHKSGHMFPYKMASNTHSLNPSHAFETAGPSGERSVCGCLPSQIRGVLNNARDGFLKGFDCGWILFLGVTLMSRLSSGNFQSSVADTVEAALHLARQQACESITRCLLKTGGCRACSTVTAKHFSLEYNGNNIELIFYNYLQDLQLYQITQVQQRQ